MRCRGWPGILLLAAWPQVAQAQAVADDSLDETQELGRHGDVLRGTQADAAARVDGALRAALKRATKAVR
jgi:hypothetical protein